MACFSQVVKFKIFVRVHNVSGHEIENLLHTLDVK